MPAWRYIIAILLEATVKHQAISADKINAITIPLVVQADTIPPTNTSVFVGVQQPAIVITHAAIPINKARMGAAITVAKIVFIGYLLIKLFIFRSVCCGQHGVCCLF